jgi:hypothetical protein
MNDIQSALKRLHAAIRELDEAYTQLINAQIPGLAARVTQEAEQGPRTLGSRSSRGRDASAGIQSRETGESGRAR